MIPRMLDHSEFATKLKGTELEAAVPYLAPHTHVLVIEQGDTVLGCWAAMNYRHVEGIWTHPDYRQSGAVGRRLLFAMGALLQQLDEKTVWTSALTPDVVDMIQRFGGKPVPGQHFILPVGREIARCP